MLQQKKHFDICILQPGYLPWLGYFDLVKISGVFVLYDDVQFDKRSWRNRNRLLNKNKPQWITVPVLTKGRFNQLIKETIILDSDWQEQHLKTIQHLYGKAPFFDLFFPTIADYLTKKQYKWLIDLCLDGHQILTNLLKINTSIKLSSEIGYQGIGRTERLVAICQTLNATRYISPNASKAYMEEPLWEKAGIKLTYQNYSHPKYKQYKNEFVSHLSVIDALMFVGLETCDFFGISQSKFKESSN